MASGCWPARVAHSRLRCASRTAAKLTHQPAAAAKPLSLSLSLLRPSLLLLSLLNLPPARPLPSPRSPTSRRPACVRSQLSRGPQSRLSAMPVSRSRSKRPSLTGRGLGRRARLDPPASCRRRWPACLGCQVADSGRHEPKGGVDGPRRRRRGRNAAALCKLDVAEGARRRAGRGAGADRRGRGCGAGLRGCAGGSTAAGRRWRG